MIFGQLSHSLTIEVYQLTSNFPKEELYGLSSQIRRAIASIPTNISEGCGRNSDKVFKHRYRFCKRNRIFTYSI